MKIGLVGYQGSGKSTLFHWLTGVKVDPAQAHLGQSAMAEIPDDRFDPLIKIFSPKKISHASIELVDTPGLARDHSGNAARLALLREATCLVFVIDAYSGIDSAADLASFDEDLLLADMEIVSSRLEKVELSLNKPMPKQEREATVHELDTLKMVLAAMESGEPLRENDLSEEQQKVTRAFRLLTEKPRLAVFNTADDEEDANKFLSHATDEMPVFAVPIGLESELFEMSPEDRAEFEAEMGVGGADRDGLICSMLKTAGFRIFFTVGEKEVRSWLLRQGGTALEAADGIHSDLARGFIRAEIMTVSDIVRLGSEREVKAAGLVRQEPKDYVVGNDDALFIKFNV
jgi:ribosome-binding ATPase